MNADPIAATRPRNRRRLIVEAAGRVFSERGYHAASMEEIAAGVGISAAALYRHFPNKYALFAECANVMVDRLVAALDDVPPEADLTAVLGAVTQVTVAQRASGGLYRWEARYLDREDRRLLWAKFARVVGRVTEAVRRESPLPDAQLRAAAALGAIGSITMHHVSIAQRRVEDVLSACALRVATTDPATSVGGPRPVELPVQPVPRTRRAEILAAAVPLFARDGFVKVTNGQIAEAVGLTTSAIYRHYPTKVDILVAACLQAAGLLAQAVDQNLDEVTDPHDAVVALAATYVAYSFEHTELTSVAEAEVAGLPADLRQPLILAQREHIAVWEQQLRLARPELDARQARVLVHAGFGVVVEAGRRLHWQDTREHRDAVTALVVGALGLQ
ncbi:TetR/AcrR family transcriptional regulator [Streptomyces caeni]|uniref:TetR/AcrR family transcriptional regulator n=1 Tax=Streptomyces caeni TaxID=2307231 RepID=A0ABW4J4F1_9ACTN